MADIERETLVPAGVTPAGLSVAPSGPVLGAEIAGLRIDGSFDARVAAGLRDLLLRYKVPFFRDLDLTHDQHLTLPGCGVNSRASGHRACAGIS